LDKLNNRGPDNTRHVSYDGGKHAYFSRLAIIKPGGTNGSIQEWQDISAEQTGIQPLEEISSDNTIRDGGWKILCNGEIFNYKDLALEFGIDKSTLRTDIDLLLRLAAKWNREPEIWLKKLNGDFAGVAFVRGDYGILFRDPTGIRPLYRAFSSDNCFLGAASLKSTLALLPGVARIEEFPPGHYWRFKSYWSTDPNDPIDNLVPTRYINLEPNLRLPGQALITNYELAKSGIYTHLESAIRKRLLHSDVPVGFLCSGGLDSSIILMLGYQIWTNELNQPPEKLRVFSIEFDGQGQSSDAFYARLLTAKLKVAHTVFKFSKEDIAANLDDIIRTVETDDYRSVRAAIPQYFLAKQIREQTDIRVIFSGEGADELFGGYNYFNLAPDGNAAVVESCRLVRNLHRYDVLRADRTISNAGLEIRVPFLDKEFIRFVNSISGQLRNTQVEKEILRDTFRDYTILTDSRIIKRPKEKFSDGCGLGYIPELMRIAARRCGADPTQSAHLLEKYERKYVRAKYLELFPADIQIASNVEFRELPEWAEKKNSELKTTGNGLNFA
jgi:asparagine synthase (glutamine-hydrolysing)